MDMKHVSENTQIEEQLIDKIADALTLKGFIQLEQFLPILLAEQLMNEAKHLALIEFKPAGIGRNTSQYLNSQVRTDATLWFNGDSAPQRAYLSWMKQLRIGLNRRLFMGLFDFECHFSHYSTGDFYQRHMDAFKGNTLQTRSNRVLSTVFYMNPDWIKNDGGELLLYADEQVLPLLIVPPLFNGCMIFLSDTFPHEVLTSRCDRYSIAGWYKVSGNSVGHLDS